MPTPYKFTPQVSSQLDFNVEVHISTSPIIVAVDGSYDNFGTWLDLNDRKVYRVAKGSFEESAMQFRREEIKNPFLEGAYTVNALRENTIETLVVRVMGDTTMDVTSAVTKLTDALSQTTFKMEVVLDNAKFSWNCYAADYTISTPVEMLHARMAMVKANIPRDPTEYVSEVI